MPAGSEQPPPVAPVVLPHTWRPLGTRMAGSVAGLGLFAMCAATWFALGEGIRDQFSPFERLTMIALGILVGVVFFALIRPRVTATETGLTVVNGYKRRDLEWAQVVAVRMRRGAPWAEMDLADGTTIPVMAIQGSDGDRAQDAVRAVRRLLADRPQAPA